MKKLDIKFILLHRDTNTEIEMPVLGICEEYSCVTFATMNGAYDDEYKGIGRLPSYPHGDDSAEDYDVFVELNGGRYIYDGIFFNGDYTETKRNHQKQ